MNLRQPLRAALVLALALAAHPARATDSHTYARDEYAIIGGGLAPNKAISLAAHGEGDGGSDNFHIWLMAEPAHRRIEPLDGIGSDNNLDTGPKAYSAQWSKDSRRVAVSFRSDRHVVELNLYTVENRKAKRVTGPSLFREIAGRDVNEDDDMRRSSPAITWRGPDRFTLTENRLFLTRDEGFAGRLGRYAKVTDKLDDGRVAVELSVEAECVVTGNRYRIIGIKAGKFGD